jgi:hypothetical protein
MAAGFSQSLSRRWMVGLLAQHPLEQFDRLVPALREEGGQSGGVIGLNGNRVHGSGLLVRLNRRNNRRAKALLDGRDNKTNIG